MTEFLLGYCDTSFNIIMDDCLNVNCDVLEYDTVLCSPPYYFKEKYENNVKYKTKEEMNDWFYRPIFKRTQNELQKHGYYIINICKEIYGRVLLPLLGPPLDMIPLKKARRQNDYKEMIYVWKWGVAPLV